MAIGMNTVRLLFRAACGMQHGCAAFSGEGSSAGRERRESGRIIVPPLTDHALRIAG